MKTLKLSVLLLTALLLITCKEVTKKEVVMVIPTTIDAFTQLELGLKEVCDSVFALQVYSAEGDATKFNTAINTALLRKPTYFISIGSQITNSALNGQFRNKLPVVIAGAVSNPDLVESLVDIGINPPRKFPLAIVKNNPRIDMYQNQLVHAFLNLKPDLKKVGIIFNESELNSKGTAEQCENALTKNGISVTKGAITSAEDIYNVTNKLIRDGVEIIIIPHDKNATSKASTIAKLCLENNIISASLDDGIIKDGIAIAISVNYKEVGKIIGRTLLEIEKNGQKPELIPVVQIEKAFIYVNIKIFEKMGLTFSSDFKEEIIKL